ncbi:MAG: DJ-1/PfpI family protein [Candidatus Peribacteria bacterium]|nr:MAG: DJ-1/PfpI family protein [Candidatus Peribacteria bacterium]
MFIGGIGSLEYIENTDMKELAWKFQDAEKLVAAICAAPRVLLAYGILDGKQVIGNDWDGSFGEMCSKVSACYMGKEK